MNNHTNRYYFKSQVIAATVMMAGLNVAAPRAATADDNGQSIHVTVNGDLVQFQGQSPIEQFGSVLVPLRGVFEKLGATVAYDGATKSILAIRGATSVQIQIGSMTAQVNGQPHTLSIPATAVNGTTLVPLRFVSEALGADVKWSGATQTVIISTNGGSNGTGTQTAQAAPMTAPAPDTERRRHRDRFDAPQVTSLSHSGGAMFRLGQTIGVTLQGTPGGAASFSLSGVTGAQDVAMNEGPTGTYTGAFTVPEGVSVKRTSLLASIRKDHMTSPMIQSDGTITIDSVGPTIGSLSPAPDTSLPPGRPLIYGTYSEGVTGINPNATRLLVDGKDVTSQATITGAFFSYKPGEDLPAGQNTVRVEAGDDAGNTVRRKWSFNVAPRENLIHDFTFSPDGNSLAPGDVLTTTLRARPGGQATFSIGGAVRERPMREESPGVYIGKYTIRTGESVTQAPVTASYTAPNGQSETQSAGATLTLSAGPPQAPTILSPTPDVPTGRDHIVLAGTAAPNATVRYEVRYQGTLLILPMDGAVTNGEVIANARGEWSVPNINLTVPLGLTKTTFTAQAVTVDASGQSSEPVRITFRK